MYQPTETDQQVIETTARLLRDLFQENWQRIRAYIDGQTDGKGKISCDIMLDYSEKAPAVLVKIKPNIRPWQDERHEEFDAPDEPVFPGMTKDELRAEGNFTVSIEPGDPAPDEEQPVAPVFEDMSENAASRPEPCDEPTEEPPHVVAGPVDEPTEESEPAPDEAPKRRGRPRKAA